LSRGKRRRHAPARAGTHLVTPTIAWIPAVVGLTVSTYLFGLDLFGGSAVCLGPSGCDTVWTSVFGRILGIPVSTIGVLFFAGALVLYCIGSARRGQPLRYFAAAGAGAATVFVALQFAVIRAICPYCLLAELAHDRRGRGRPIGDLCRGPPRHTWGPATRPISRGTSRTAGTSSTGSFGAGTAASRKRCSGPRRRYCHTLSAILGARTRRLPGARRVAFELIRHGSSRGNWSKER
jgi:uncharacterized membrane protein